MHTEDLTFNDSAKRQQIEDLIKSLPRLQRYLLFALLVKAKKTIYSSDLVVASQKEDVLREFNLIG